MKDKNILIVGGAILVIAVAAVYFGFQRQNNLQRSLEETSTTAVTETIQPTTASETASVQTFEEGLALTISQPQDKEILTTNQVTVKGKTKANAEVFVNDTELKADASGNFSALLTLDEGENYITVVANDELGNFAEKEIMVTVSAEKE